MDRTWSLGVGHSSRRPGPSGSRPRRRAPVRRHRTTGSGEQALHARMPQERDDAREQGHRHVLPLAHGRGLHGAHQQVAHHAAAAAGHEGQYADPEDIEAVFHADPRAADGEDRRAREVEHDHQEIDRCRRRCHEGGSPSMRDRSRAVPPQNGHAVATTAITDPWACPPPGHQPSASTSGVGGGRPIGRATIARTTPCRGAMSVRSA